VNCPRCGTETPDDSVYCPNCGTLLARAAEAPQAFSAPQTPPSGPQADTNPLMAGVLNLFFGLGYVYLGYAKVMRVNAAAFVALMIVLYFVAGVVTDGLASLVIAALLSADGYQKGAGLSGYISAERPAPSAQSRA